MLEGLQLDLERERQRIVHFIRAQLDQTGYSRLVIGLSGGIDSALVAALSMEATSPQDVRAMILPYKTSNPESEAHARLVIDQLGLSCERFEITDMVEPLIARDPAIDGRRKGNIMARCRMIALYDQSAAFRALVVGTSNRTETLLGYFTMFGDGAAAFKPIAHLYKYQVRALSRHVGVPQAIIDKAPSADLWAGQTDEGELGFTYDEADQVLYLLTEREMTVDEAASQGFDLRVVRAISHRLETSAFKREAPATLPTNNR